MRSTFPRPASASAAWIPSATSAGAWDSSFPGRASKSAAPGSGLCRTTRKNAFGFHMGWQSSKVPLSVRSEMARSYEGSGYWIEGAYRLSQAHFWQKAMRHTELVARAQEYLRRRDRRGRRREPRPAQRGYPRGRFRRQLLAARWAERHCQLRPPVQFGRQRQPVELWLRLPFPGSTGARRRASHENHSFHMKTSVTILLCVLCASRLASSVFAGSPAEGQRSLQPARR